MLRTGVRAWAGSRSPIEVADLLAEAGVAASPVFTGKDVLADPHVEARHMIVEIPNADGPDPVTTGNPVKMTGVSEGPDTAPPTLGQHTDEVLAAELGLSAGDLASLRSEGAIG